MARIPAIWEWSASQMPTSQSGARFWRTGSNLPAMNKCDSDFADLLEPYSGHPELYRRVSFVLTAIPQKVQRDFLDDPRFQTALHDFVPGKGTTLNLAAPCPTGKSSRCVVLKPLLATSSVEFAHYVIAHEFAHAYLRNGGWGAINDHEEAADALAASWGFSRPPRRLWPFSKWPSRKI